MGNERRTRLSPEGRLRCSEAGRASLPALLEARRTVTNAKQVSKEFEAELTAELGGDLTPSQRALTISATASYTALFIVSQKLRTAHRYKVIAGLIEQVTPLVGSLHRSLRSLGVSASAVVGDEPDPASLSPEERRKWARQYVKDVLSADGSAS